MSELTGGNNLDPTFSVAVDPSAEDLPLTMVGAYGSMNEYIARDRAHFGLTLQSKHLMYSRRDITETAQHALRRTQQGDERTAIILGAGGCLDIPLEQLVTDFDKTTVVDVHTEQTEQALSDLSPKLLGKVSLVQADLSGLAKGVNDTFELASKEEKYDRFLDVASALIRKFDVDSFRVDFGSDYAFVCSQLLMTQLCSIPFKHFNRMTAEKYGKPLTMARGNEDEQLVDAINEQSIKVQTDHIAWLNQLSHANGTVHFADTMGEIRNGAMLPMVSYEVVKAIDRRFNELREMKVWEYNVSQRQAFVVGSYSLAPKPAVQPSTE